MTLRSFFMGIMLMVVVSASAQQQAAAVSEEKGGSEKAEMLSMANKLVKYGYQTKKAMPIIQALDIYNQFSFTDGTETKAAEGDGFVQAGEEASKGNLVSFDKDKLIADATAFADGDKNLLAIIKSVSSTRGATYGAKRIVDSVKAGYTDTWTISFRGGEQAIVVVSGDGDTDLDLYVYDENGNFITSDTDNSDDCVVSFNPRWTGNFKIKIKNLGRVYNKYVLVTN